MRVYARDTLLAERRQGVHELELPYQVLDGGTLVRKSVKTKIVNGEIEALEFSRPLGEMLTTPANLYEVIQKSVIDIRIGREAVPLLYQPIYRRIEDANFSQFVDTTPFGYGKVVFLQRMEGEEVKFGTRELGPKETIPIVSYAAALQWTEEMRIYDSTWSFAEANRAIGEAYNALLNHLHLAPILQFSYPAKNQTGAATAGETYYVKLRNTLQNALKHANEDKNTTTRRVRQPRILLAHPSKRWDLEIALGRMVVAGSEYPALGNSPLGGGVDSMIFYDGYEIQVGERLYSYPGVDPAKAYLIDPGPGGNHFVELVKYDLLVDAGGADITRLIENAIVARTYRGLYANIADAVEEITLPTA